MDYVIVLLTVFVLTAIKWSSSGNALTTEEKHTDIALPIGHNLGLEKDPDAFMLILKQLGLK